MPLAIIMVCVGIYVVAGVTYALVKMADYGRRIEKIEDEVEK